MTVALHRSRARFRFLISSESVAETIRISGSSDIAYCMGRVTNVFKGAQGPVEYAGKFLTVWEKTQGEWSIVVYSVSNNRNDTGDKQQR